MGTSWNLQSQLLVAIQNDNLDRVRSLLEAGLDVDLRFQTESLKQPAVCLCVKRGNRLMVELLLSWGCSINQSDSSGFTPLHIATSYCNEDMVNILIKNRANINALTNQGYTSLHLASQRPSVDSVALLVEAGADIDFVDFERKTALIHACIHGNGAVASYLIKKGANVNSCDTSVNTPLLYAVNSHFSEHDIVNLLDAGALINQKNSQGETPLHAVVRGRRLDKSLMLDVLLSRKCSLDLQTNLGHTPLHLAVLEHDYYSAVKLIKSGCDVNRQDRLGLNPLFYALKDGNHNLSELIIAAGSKINLKDWIEKRSLELEAKDHSLLFDVQKYVMECNKLKFICRQTIRQHYGSRIMDFVAKSNLPATLKKYLLLDIL